MKILGISALYHDSAAALLVDGTIVAAAQEERFSRLRHDSDFPVQASRYCLAAGEVSVSSLDAIVFYENPLLKFDRIIQALTTCTDSWAELNVNLLYRWANRGALARKRFLQFLKLLGGTNRELKKVSFCEHHLSHAASAFYPSPFDEATVLCIDGVGEWATTSCYEFKVGTPSLVRQQYFPHSLGLLYSIFTDHLGFRVNSGEYKVMGLASYGSPRYKSAIYDTLLDLSQDGNLCLNADYFTFANSETMASHSFDSLFALPRRQPHEELTQCHADLAASIQSVLTEALNRLVTSSIRSTGIRKVCMAGGVALNCVANKTLRERSDLDGLWIQPAAGDSGGALGAAYVGYHLRFGSSRTVGSHDAMNGCLLGPEFDDLSIEASITSADLKSRRLKAQELSGAAAALLVQGHVVGWFQGRMEFGPRALGARSILADPRNPALREILNERIKLREPFRPFGGSVLEEHSAAWFKPGTQTPFMLFTTEVRGIQGSLRDRVATLELTTPVGPLPAITHVDGSCRLQTVGSEAVPRFRDLLLEFYRLTGCPVLLNTSFNVRGEPIVCTPGDALRAFLNMGLDDLFIGLAHLKGNEQPATARQLFKQSFMPD